MAIITDVTTLPVLQVAELTKSYRGMHALDDVSFSVPRGALTVVLGAAGAGKTTLLRSIAGLEQPEHGGISIDGRDCAGLEPKDRDLAMIFDNLALYPDKTGFDNIANPLRIRGEAKEAIARKVDEIAARLRIAHILSRKPKTMSGGERQRVALGRALVREPRLFLLDEPLSSLDAMLRIELRAELRRLQKDLGYTFVLATPDFSEAMALADTVIMLRAGRVVQIADPQTLYDAPADREVARFVGAPEINLLPARFEPENGGQIRLAGGVCPAPPGFARMRPQGCFEFEAGLRPEDLRFAVEGEGSLSGIVTDIEPLGLNAAATVATGGEDLLIVTKAAVMAGIYVGRPVSLSIASERLLAFDSKTGGRLF